MTRYQALMILSVLAFSNSCSLCGNEIQSEVVSPDGKMKAVIFERDCGATTSATTQISILGAHDGLPNEVGNAFVLDDEPKFLKLKAVWTSPRKLEFFYHPRSGKIFKLEHHINVSTGFFKWEVVDFDIGEIDKVKVR
jgi:hypothetical protein